MHMIDEPGRIMRMLTTPSFNVKTWKQAPGRACLILLTLYVYYTPGWGKAQTWERLDSPKAFCNPGATGSILI